MLEVLRNCRERCGKSRLTLTFYIHGSHPNLVGRASAQTDK